ncbi:MAG: RNA 2'-phosphotransferase [Ruminococcaceae bacterium]|nr:RNA 2'-phosphotransferase [Oscillospiraceae bacterium]
MNYTKLSIYLSCLLRHQPELLGLDMDVHGYVPVEQLINAINKAGKHTITREILDQIVETDDKKRYKYSEGGYRIKACQGHSIPWVIPELTYAPPPALLYHGTTEQAYAKILSSGGISRMNRHAVHTQATAEPAWKSARRWKKQSPVVLVINAARMAEDGFQFGVSDNGVWCIESVPAEYIADVLRP